MTMTTSDAPPPAFLSGLPPRRLHFVEDYRRLVKHLIATMPLEQAMSKAVGGNFEAIGEVEMRLLVHLGLQPYHSLVDVGCGSGRLAKRLAKYLSGGMYTGIDVVPELLEYARQGLPAHWQFITIDKFTELNPVADLADFVCFFSVFTHLLPEESFVYLDLARQSLRPGGRVVFSFLEYDLHWDVFQESIDRARRDVSPPHLNTLLSRDTIGIWAERLGMKLAEIHRGDEAFIPISQPLILDDGTTIHDWAQLGQSLVVLEQ